MKLKNAKSIAVKISLTIIAIILIVITYYKITDIETKIPKGIEENISIETEMFMGRKVFKISPKDTTSSKTTILYFHGGSYMAEATENHWRFIEKIVDDTGATIIFPDYPLAPKYTYKDVFKMVTPLYKEIIEKVEPENLIVLGDSAGGGIALALVEKLSQESVVLPKKTILISPWLDVRLTNPKIEEIQKEDTELSKEALKLAGIAYASDDGINSYLVNPIDGNLSKLKNVTILTGTKDILNPDTHVLQEKAKEIGVNIELKEYENAMHIWMIEKNSGKELIEKGYNDFLDLIND